MIDALAGKEHMPLGQPQTVAASDAESDMKSDHNPGTTSPMREEDVGLVDSSNATYTDNAGLVIRRSGHHELRTDDDLGWCPVPLIQMNPLTFLMLQICLTKSQKEDPG